MNLKAILKSSNNRMYKLLLILLAGVCLMIVVWPVSKKQDEDTETAGRSYTKSVADSAADDDDASDPSNSGGEAGMTATAAYAENMEKRLTDMLSNMDGISDVSVMITVKDSGEKVALKDRSMNKSEGSGSSQSSVTEDTVIRDDGSVKEPYVTKYNEPEIEGVVICCRGAENGEISLNITNAVQALFDVPVHKIVILEAN